MASGVTPELGDIPPTPGDIPRSSDRLPISFWVVVSYSSDTADTVLRHQSDLTQPSKSMAPSSADFTGSRCSVWLGLRSMIESDQSEC